MISIKNEEEIELMRQSGKLLANLMQKLIRAVKPGIFTIELENLANEFIIANKVQPAFKGFPSGERGVPAYPAVLCLSVNEEIVHGIPSKKRLNQGDIISIDAGLKFKGYCSDMAVTLPVGKVKKEAKQLLTVTKKALYAGINQVRAGAYLGDVSAAIENYVYSHHFYVIRELTGHGIGRSLHEPPIVFNYGSTGTGPQLKKGMTLAIEPLVSPSTEEMKSKKDGWTIVTADSSLAAHFEHTILVTERGREILTQYE